MPQRYKLFFISPNISPNFFQKKKQRQLFAAAFNPIPDYYDERIIGTGSQLLTRPTLWVHFIPVPMTRSYIPKIFCCENHVSPESSSSLADGGFGRAAWMLHEGGG